MDEEEFEEFMQQHQSELQQLGYGSTNQQQEHHVEGDQYYHSQEAEHEAEQQYMYQQQQQQQQYPQDYPQEDFSQHYQHQPQPPYQQYQQQQQDYNQFESDDISLADLASIEIHADDQSVVSNMTGFRSVRSNMTDPNLSVVERSNLMLQYKQEKIESLRREQERQERDSMKQQPTITNKSKQKQRSVEDMLQWEKERQAKLQARAQMIDEQHRTEQTGRPQVTKLANKLAQRWREDEEDATLGNYDAQSVATSIASKSVQERLYEYEDRKKMKLQMMIDRQNYEARMNAKPKLVSRSANYVRGGQSVASEEGSVSERLYALAELRKVNPMPSMINGSKPIQHDETTGQRLFEVRHVYYPIPRFSSLIFSFSRLA